MSDDARPRSTDSAWFAERLRERVYVGFTVLAVLLALSAHADELAPVQVEGHVLEDLASIQLHSEMPDAEQRRFVGGHLLELLGEAPDALRPPQMQQRGEPPLVARPLQ